MNKKLLVIIPTLIVLVIVGVLVLKIKKCRINLPAAGSNLSQALPLINQAKELEAKGSFVEARSAYQKLVSDFSNSPEVNTLTVEAALTPLPISSPEGEFIPEAISAPA